MLRAVLFAGSSFALKSVFLRVEAFALYVSPKPPPLPTIGAFVAPVLPRLVATMTSVAPSRTKTGSRRRTCLAPGFLRACILCLLSPFSARAFDDSAAVARRRLSWPEDTSEERRDSIPGDQHPDDDRPPEDDELHRRREAENAKHLRQQGECQRCDPRRRCAREPSRERRARDHDRGDRRQQVRRPEAGVDADANTGEQDRCQPVEDARGDVRETD